MKISELIKILEPLPKEGYLVGGVVRDLYLSSTGVSPKRDLDIDILFESDFRPLLKDLPISYFPNFLTAKLKLGDFNIDLVQARKESYSSPGALPSVSPGTLIDDLERRDFTINALLLPINLLSDRPIESLVLDYVGGVKDLQEKKLRVFHKNSFADDPTRILRAARYAARISGDLEKNTAIYLQDSIKYLKSISSFRVFNEFKRIFEEENFESLDIFFSKYGLYQYFPWISFKDIKVRGVDNVCSFLLKSSADFLSFLKEAQVSKRIIQRWGKSYWD